MSYIYAHIRDPEYSTRGILYIYENSFGYRGHSLEELYVRMERCSFVHYKAKNVCTNKVHESDPWHL